MVPHDTLRNVPPALTSASPVILADIHLDAKDRDARKDQTETDEQSMEFSLVTGAYRTRKTFENGTTCVDKASADGKQAMTVRNKDFTLAKLESAGSKCPYPLLQRVNPD